MSETPFALSGACDVISLPATNSPRSLSAASSWTVLDAQPLCNHPLLVESICDSPGDRGVSEWSVMTVDGADLGERPLLAGRYALWPSGDVDLACCRRPASGGIDMSAGGGLIGGHRAAFLWAPRELLRSESEPPTEKGSSRVSAAESDGAASCGTLSGNSGEASEEAEQRGALLDPLLRMGFLRALLLHTLRGSRAAKESRRARRKRKSEGASDETQDTWSAVGHWIAANAESFVSSTLQGIIVFVI